MVAENVRNLTNFVLFFSMTLNTKGIKMKIF